MDIQAKIQALAEELAGTGVRIVAVSKTKPLEDIEQAYAAGARAFGENKVQELTDKHEHMPTLPDLEWHYIGHLQSNKVKYMASFVHLIHGVDRPKILKEINKQAAKHERVQDCLLQIHIAQEESKFGFSYEEAEAFLKSPELGEMAHIRILGFMGMATHTPDEAQIRQEFRGLKQFSDRMKKEIQNSPVELQELSMGMSGDYKIAVEEGSTMIRVGSSIFGARHY